MADRPRTFLAERFIDNFHAREDLLLAFVSRCQSGLDLASLGDAPGVQTFKDWLAALPSDARDELIDTISQIYDLCCVPGQQCLLQVLREAEDYDHDLDDPLPVACLSLKTWLERPDLFRLAFDRHAAEQAGPFEIYVSADGTAADLETSPPEHVIINSSGDQVRLRPYEVQDFKSFINYHEKHVTNELSLAGGGHCAPAVPRVLRPAQPDCDNCPRTNGPIKTQTPHEEAVGDLDLARLVDPDFAMPVDGPDRAYLTEVHFQTHAASDLERDDVSFVIQGRDVLPALHAPLRRTMDPRAVRRAVIKFYFAGSRRARPVIIAAANKVSFPHASRRFEAFRYLKQWGLMT